MSSCSFLFIFFKQKTAYEMRISDWSSDVCSSDLKSPTEVPVCVMTVVGDIVHPLFRRSAEDGDAPCRMPRSAGLAAFLANGVIRSDESRVGKECVSKCRSRWPTDH